MADLLALTAELVDLPSVSFAEGPMVERLEAELSRCEHLEVVRVGDNLVCRTNLGRSRRLILAGHTDTVPPNGNARSRIEGDVLWGVGSADMKSGLAVFLDLARSVSEPVVDVTYVFYAREEVAQEHSGLAELVLQRPDLLTGDCAILGEPTDGAVEAGCQGALRVQVDLVGARAHTARPWMGRNAIHRLGPILETLAGYESRRPTIDGCTYGEQVQAVSVDGGVAGNVVPDRVSLRIHHRYAPDRSPAQAEAFLEDLLAPHLEEGDTITVEDQSPPCPPSLEDPLLKRLVLDNDVEVRAKVGWTDVARFAQLGIPATNFGPGDPKLAHNRDERVERASIEAVHRAVRGLLVADR